MADSDSFSNSDLLKREQEAFSNVQLPLDRPDSLGGGELPFIVGVIDDFSGNAPVKPKADLSQREFDQVSVRTLDKKLAEVGPGLEYQVRSTLPKSINPDDSMHVKLWFNEMKDFEPKRVAEKVPALNNLLKLREQLEMLRHRAATSPELQKELVKLMTQLLEQKH